ncbi:hypothetical protein SAMD00019534_049340 [Acytostelium subglobosum LB1]|uniref:hypothetical protein n=1 Tax=Acytostelium subglobosum LB1 TaxID=1410327 RepID=UPI0006451E03|nr:hypothetical protein SAMD00019534_049340 [Acytostelium subglobosum LB1]GAM21759.1 hypothetical protein SAMD00019534_049340 [Acytostelium subglobosum LB1]|eukprot:XP_012754859.1 hypothetical protein SAMD00019534_049340 [Acytostelium subglobosum LB1]
MSFTVNIGGSSVTGSSGGFFGGVVSAIHEAFVPIDNRNKIWVTMSQSSYVGGDMLMGTVEMDCIVPFFAKGVLVKFKGFERVFFTETKTEWEGEGSNRKSVQRTYECKENKEFFRSTLCVYPHQGQVNPGHYSFPFQYQLPPSLPGTFCEEDKDSYGQPFYAKVLYKVKATVDVHHKHDLKHTCRLVVNERCNELVQPSFAENRKSFFLTKGKIVAKAWLNKNAYIPGETLVGKLKINNTSVKPTRRISLKVHHTIELRAQHNTKVIKHCVYKQEYPGIQPCYYGKRYIPFYIPVDLKPSSLSGGHVKSTYILDIEFDIPGAIDLHVPLPLTLFAPQYLYSTVPPQPPGAPLPPDVSYRHPWEDETAVAHCGKCRSNFGLFNRKHHCRHCMKVFCGKCTAKTTPITKLNYPKFVRVCDDCFPVASQGGVKYQSAKALAAAYNQALSEYYAQYSQQYPWMAQMAAPAAVHPAAAVAPMPSAPPM